jgi:hypothetical protein
MRWPCLGIPKDSLTDQRGIGKIGARLEHGYLTPHVLLPLRCLEMDLWGPYWPSNSAVFSIALGSKG